MINVKAAFPEDKFGFYANQRRYDGEEFKIKSMEEFSEVWMVNLDPEEIEEEIIEKVTLKTSTKATPEGLTV